MGAISVRPAVIVLHKGKLLVVKSKYPDGEYYLLPGGGIEGTETIVECAIRETLEETGQLIKIVKIAFLNDYITNQGRCLNIFLYGEIVKEKKIDNSIVRDNGKILAVEWRTVEELNHLNFKPKILLSKINGDQHLTAIEEMYFRTS
jgi:8-oxo-dGTP diphosphatase